MMASAIPAEDSVASSTGSQILADRDTARFRFGVSGAAGAGVSGRAFGAGVGISLDLGAQVTGLYAVYSHTTVT